MPIPEIQTNKLQDFFYEFGLFNVVLTEIRNVMIVFF